MASNLDINQRIINISKTISINTQAAKSTNNTIAGQGQNVDFKTLLQQQLQTKSEVTFSKHAMQRVADRQIDVSANMMQKLNDAVCKAKAKGVKDALVLNGDSMFIVNTMSNTVITALKGSEMKDNVFTNIDGTVII